MVATVAIVLVSLLALAALGVFALDRFLAGLPQDIDLLSRQDVNQNGQPLRVLMPATEEQKGRGLSGIEALTYPTDTS